MNNNIPQVAVIIASYNGESVIRLCLSSIQNSDYANINIVVVNNGSTDTTKQIIEQQFPDITLVNSPVNLGFAGGYNLGIQSVPEAQYYFLVNDDVELAKNCISQIVQAFQNDARVGIIGCKILYPDKKTIQHAGGIIYPNARTWHNGYEEEDKGQWDTMYEPDYVTGAAFAFRQELIQRLGYLDESYRPIYFEETDYCYRAKRIGYKVVYLPTALVYHYESRTTVKYSPSFFTIYHRNRIRFMLKNFPFSKLRLACKEEIKYLKTIKDDMIYRAVIRAYQYHVIRLPFTLWHRYRTFWNDRRNMLTL
ncbi:MAG: glycosyltransferase family 2 protein [bacterium]|nr:glycosyltransferase family 2 protein [bacterium]